MKSAQLTLIDPLSPSDISPLSGGETEGVKEISWQQKFAAYFYYQYAEVTGKKSKLGFGALKKMLDQHARKYWVDGDTGAPEVPTFEEWKDEVDAFWLDKFAAEERGFHFSYLLKQYGSFKKFKPIKRTVDNNVMISYTCASCSNVMKYARAFWMKFRNQTGHCKKCGAAFNVNDVLSIVPTLQDYLPPVENK